MVDPTKQRGEAGRPIGPEPEKDQQVDPEKFKKIMKVEASTEAEKRQKRRLKKGEEDAEEGEDIEEGVPTPPPNSFAEFMEDKNELDNLFDTESPGIRKQATPKTSTRTPELGSISTEGVELNENPEPDPPTTQSQPSPHEPQQTPTPEHSQEPSPPPYPETPPLPPNYSIDHSQPNQNENQDKPDEQKKQQEVHSKDQTHQHKKHPPIKEKEKDSSLLASHPEKDALKSKIMPSKPAPHIEKVTSHEEVPNQSPKKFEDPLVTSDSKEKTELQNPFPHAGEESIMPVFNQTSSFSSEGKKSDDEEKAPRKTPLLENTQSSPELKEMPPLKGEKESEKIRSDIAAKTGDITSTPESRDQPPKRPIREKQMVFTRFTPEQIYNKKKKKPPPLSKNLDNSAELTIPLSPEADMGMMDDERKDRKDDFLFINAEHLTTTLPIAESTIPPVTPSPDTPIYSKLSPEIYELFEKMVGTIMIQDHSGITSTTITLNMPDSIFDGAQVTFDQYKTAPNSYNLQFLGSPQAIEAFAANMADLVAAFKQGQHAFEVNILRPALSEKKPLIHRKGAAGNGGDSGGHNKR